MLAMFLYSPYGTLVIEETAAQVVMTACQASAFAVLLIAPRSPIKIWKRKK